MNYIRTLSIMLVAASFLLAGCGENMFKNQAKTGSVEAQKEEAKIALDTGDYLAAITVLQKMCGDTDDPSALTCDKDSKVDLAAAYLAEATGLDVLKLIAEAESTTAPKPMVLYSVSSTESENFKKISKLLDIDKITACIEELTTSTNCKMKQRLSRAIDILNAILPDNPDINTLSRGDKNLYLQLGIASAVDLVISVGVVSGGFFPSDFLPKTIPAIETPVITANITDINRDLSKIGKGLENSGILTNFPNIDVSNVIKKIKDQLDKNSNDMIDFAELKAYITSLIGTSPHCS